MSLRRNGRRALGLEALEAREVLSANPIVLDANDYMDGTDASQLFDGVSLIDIDGANDDYNIFDTVGEKVYVYDSPVQGNEKVFAQQYSNSKTWTKVHSVLKVSFDNPTDEVEFEMTGGNYFSSNRVEFRMYDSNYRFLDVEYESLGIQTWKDVELTRSSADISHVVVIANSTSGTSQKSWNRFFLSEISYNKITPTSAVDDRFQVLEDGNLTGNVANNDSFDGSAAFNLKTSAQNGNVTLRQDGSFLYQPNQDFYGVDEFEYRVTANGTASTAKVKITVTRQLDDPEETGRIIGTKGNDQIMIRALTDRFEVTLNGETINVMHNVTNKLFFDGNGGYDSVRVIGNESNERIVLGPSAGRVVSAGYRINLSDADSIFVNAGGGRDTLRMDGSNGVDSFEGSLTQSKLRGPNYFIRVRNAEMVRVRALDGRDQAKFMDSQLDERFAVRPSFAKLSANGNFIAVRNFEGVEFDGRYLGADRAVVFDSPSDDVLRINGNQLAMNSESYSIDVSGIARAVVRGSNGNDRVELEDHSGNDFLRASGSVINYRTSRTAFRLSNFDDVTATSENGGFDQLDLRSIDFVFENVGNWRRI